jgi:L-fuconolactonase
MPIIDTHTHFYDPSRPEGVPWPPKSNELLYRTVLPADFRAAAAPVGITKTVVVEASTWPTDNRWILELAEGDDSIVGFVGYADIASVDFAGEIAEYVPHPLFRGIRAHGNLQQLLVREVCLGNLRALAELDLSLDLLARPDDLPAVAAVAREIPSLRMVLDHVAHVPIDGSDPAEGWVRGISDLAGCANVFCKVSGLVESAVERPAPDDPAYYRPTLEVLFRELGAERLTYASNWPVCEQAARYETTYRVVDAFLSSRSADERRWVEELTATRAYKVSL